MQFSQAHPEMGISSICPDLGKHEQPQRTCGCLQCNDIKVSLEHQQKAERKLGVVSAFVKDGMVGEIYNLNQKWVCAPIWECMNSCNRLAVACNVMTICDRRVSLENHQKIDKNSEQCQLL